MSNVSADLRICPNKEMFSVDMAEVLDAAILKDGIIQGCKIKEEAGVLKVKTNGRVIINGRLGVITAGDIPVPTLSTQQSTACTVVAVCNLQDDAFYISIVDSNGLQTLNSARSNGDVFNVEGTLDYVILGTVVVNPVTGLVSSWTPSTDTATAHKGKNVYQELLNKFTALETSINNKLTWKTASQTDYKGTPYHEVPSNAKEIYVVVWIRWISTGSATQKTSLGFHIPINDYLFVSSADLVGHVNHWSKTNDGFVRLRLSKANGKYLIKIYNVYQGNTDVTANTYWNIMYR